MDDQDRLAGIAPDRLKRWAELGVAQVKVNLEQTGGIRVVGGPPEVRQQAWRWVEYMEAQRAAAVAAPKLWDVVTAKPSFAGFSIDLVTAEAWLKAWRRK